MTNAVTKTTPRRRLIAYLVIAVIAAVGVWKATDVAQESHDAALQAKATAEAEAQEDKVEDAEQCITAWDVRERIRDAIESSNNGNRAAIIEAFEPFVKSQKNLEAFAQKYKETQARWIDQVRNEIPNPECDQVRAQSVLQAEAVAGTAGVVAGHGNLGLHWGRYGPDTAQTWIYFENHLASYQGPYLQWYANRLTQHPELAVRVVADCGTHRNCVQWFTKDMNLHGLTWVSWNSNKHLVDAWVKLDPEVGSGALGNLGSKRVVWHEGCHSTGQGFQEAYHSHCNSTYWQHHWSTLSRYYHNDPG